MIPARHSGKVCKHGRKNLIGNAAGSGVGFAVDVANAAM
jgi:hypothetical protein